MNTIRQVFFVSLISIATFLALPLRAFAVSEHAGWAYVNGGATPSVNEYYNPSGTTVTLASGHTTGQYSLYFNGVAHSGSTAVAHVVAVGSSARCQLFSIPTGNGLYTLVTVLCYDSTVTTSDSPIDSNFLVYLDDRSGNVSTGAYAAISGGSCADMPSCNPTVSWNSTGVTGANTYTTSTSSPTYTVTLGGMASSNAGVHVTAMGAAGARCIISNWGSNGIDASVQVNCYNHAGTRTTTGFVLSYLVGDTQISNRTGGHAWVHSDSITSGFAYAQPYEAVICGGSTPVWSATPNGNLSDVQETYADAPSESTYWNILPLVSAYGTSTGHCNLNDWYVSLGRGFAAVQCFDGSGTQVNANSSQFTFSFMTRTTPTC